MKLRDLAGVLPVEGTASADLEVTGISSDSRQVKPGVVFFALAGTKADGAAYAADAARRGALAVVAGKSNSVAGLPVPVLTVDDPRLALALSAARYFGKQPRTMVAVTGTSGKTSVAAFTRQIWEQAGYAAASIGTTGVVAPGRNEYGSLTTPDPVALHQLLRELADAGVTYASMEASSHGLDQRRLDGVKLAAGGFTNLGRDHMDYHPTVEDYHRAKLRLFDTLLPKGAPAVIFADDPWSAPTIQAAQAAGLNVLTVGRHGDFLTLKRVEHERHRQRAEVEAEGVLYEIDLPLAGDFQISNALVSAGLAISTGTPVAKALAALEKLKGAPGRLDLVGTTVSGAPVYVDYAHKPDALENVLASVRPFTTGRVMVVFGCGGDRDRGKRPIMGEIATRLADVVIVTDDNPRSEVPETIRAAILAAAPGAIEIGDRRKAIHEAVGMLHAGDTLIVAGKGHEEGQTIGSETLHFSDHEEVRAALRERAA
ncbi:UDP-N-acetylmuramoyl-L-alanyl-D-glutamate--2,6-diaminopimelate ligase [Mesorhizobium japonicum]|uniref:UDP-N-acetylmuramoyl-L-alanyl-D-glutamate--2,6-diaminopimelate ligase n=1 Tax=Mesorhizobium japonicum (strain LMG 29417 / CECT 9101 / MAFF 303099) TaxID=266835 RepID=MURE_RHILO|nr:UDP-N-acetylmuramoyl-L-alanyl-D-glutamate--2,6-diaminopimelate ligase [Mesorhizobium japonicum]Q98KA8.1 RecName: Full=UDP-N-acetylmuramoyl-L-alanyl-D-glutamate--2,6-diaminopimelate ligase; AltName: Full=Meso-A2pm-adding enzyme; AltName: Full=Meso-diaminopimelate-adding enzyme; AltName: Full=UDP-MurNAc-L-Ala-D-Glu:meso-diaminopimelate ligase; AltName: Full=UDP-MurNAc-tripeptide synthetase; AltName: Full=UDP-N-acetylmuramyl-tripeptide synthetase [Mesorhizobium japonicum MAFF 303099]BAB48906.1 UD